MSTKIRRKLCRFANVEAIHESPAKASQFSCHCEEGFARRGNDRNFVGEGQCPSRPVAAYRLVIVGRIDVFFLNTAGFYFVRLWEGQCPSPTFALVHNCRAGAIYESPAPAK